MSKFSTLHPLLAKHRVTQSAQGKATGLPGPRVVLHVSVTELPAGYTLTAQVQELDPATQTVRAGAQVAQTTLTQSGEAYLVLPYVASRAVQWTVEARDDADALTSIDNVSLGLVAEPVVNTMDEDGRQIMVLNPASEGTETMYVGDADDGTPMVVSLDGPGSANVDIAFDAVVEVNDGEAWWNPSEWDHTDKFSFVARLPETPASETPGAGGYAKVAVGGEAHMFVPDPNGDWTIDLSTAVPVPMPGGTGGYFDVDWSAPAGTVTVAQNGGGAGYGLFDVEQTKHLVRNIYCGNPLGVFAIDPYKVERIHPRWVVQLDVTKASAGAGVLGGWLMTFRR